MNAREWKQYPRQKKEKKKKAEEEFVSELQGIHLDYMWGKNWSAEDRKGPIKRACCLVVGV